MCNKSGLGTKDYLFLQVFSSKILQQHEWQIITFKHEFNVSLQRWSSLTHDVICGDDVTLSGFILVKEETQPTTSVHTPALISLHWMRWRLCRMPCCHGAYYHLHHVHPHHHETLAVTAKWSQRQTGPKAAFLHYYQEKKLLFCSQFWWNFLLFGQ